MLSRFGCTHVRRCLDQCVDVRSGVSAVCRAALCLAVRQKAARLGINASFRERVEAQVSVGVTVRIGPSGALGADSDGRVALHHAVAADMRAESVVPANAAAVRRHAVAARCHQIVDEDEVVGRWRHYWDEGRHWRTTLRAGYLINNDNGSGYFDYDRVQASFQVRWQRGGWDASFQARGGWYAYPNQFIVDSERERSYYTLDLRVERKLDRNWLIYARGGREWNLSNDPLDEYGDWVATAGLGVEF